MKTHLDLTSRLAIHGGTPVRTVEFPKWPEYRKADEELLLSVLRSRSWSRRTGEQVAQFEREFAAYHDCTHGIAVSSGTAALKVAILSCDLDAGAEILVPAYSFLATASAVIECNCKPVFIDVRRDSFNIDSQAIEAAITNGTKAIIVVHFGGLAANMQRILGIAQRYDLQVIEDAAQAHGAEFDGKRVGSLSDCGCFSFQASKILTCGEGGIVTTSDPERARKCRDISDWGTRTFDGHFDQSRFSGNFRLSEFQGAVLNSQFAVFEDQCKRRAVNSDLLLSKLSQLPGIATQAVTKLSTRHAHSLIALRVSESRFGMDRSELVKCLKAEGIPASVGYSRPLYMHPIHKNKQCSPFDNFKIGLSPDCAAPNCPNSEVLCDKEALWLDQRVLLGKRRDVLDVVDAFYKIRESVSG